MPSGPGGRVALDIDNLPLWFHGNVSFDVAEARLRRADLGLGAFLVTETYPDTVYMLVFVDSDGEVRQAAITRSERKDGSMGTHFLVEDVRLRECKDVTMVIMHLNSDNGPDLPRIRAERAVRCL